MGKQVTYRQLLEFIIDVLTEAECKEVIRYLLVMAELEEHRDRPNLLDHLFEDAVNPSWKN